MNFILIVANKIGLTDYEHIAIDGTIKKAYNSPFNIIKEKDLSLFYYAFRTMGDIVERQPLRLSDDKADRYPHVHLCQLLYAHWFQYNIFCALYSVFSVWYQYYYSTPVGIAV